MDTRQIEVSVDEATMPVAGGSNHVLVVDAIPYVTKPTVKDRSTHSESTFLAIVRISKGAALILRVCAFCWSQVDRDRAKRIEICSG